MLQHYLVIAVRNLARHKTFSLINIGGLAVSLASCLFIFYYVYDEFTYDRFHEKAGRIVRITQTFTTPESTQNIRFTNQKVGLHLHRVYPQVENYVRFEDGELRLGKSKIKEKGAFRTDPTVFEVFSYPLIKGNPQTALAQPHSIVLSESLAEKYFDGDPIGSTLEVEGEPHTVTGIMQDVPSNSDKWVSALIRGEFGGEEIPNLYFTYDTYLLLRKPEDAVFIRKNLASVAAALHDQSQPVRMGYEMQALTSLHFFHGTEMDNPKGNKTNVYIFALVALVLLVVSVFNFINLTTMRALARAKEVGIRTTSGAQRSQRVRQFLSESLLAVSAAGCIAVVIINVFKLIFESISGKTIALSNPHDLTILGTTLLLLILIVVCSSFYPAWILSSYHPIQVLRGKNAGHVGGGSIRKTFTVGQFALSTALMLFLTAILLQMDFMHSADLGFTKEEILVLKAPEDSLVSTNLAYYKNEFLKNKAVEQVSVGGFASNLGTHEPFASPIFISTGAEERQLIVPNIVVDKDYPGMLQLKVQHGKAFSEMESEDIGRSALVNQSFVKLAGWADPIGKKIRTYGGEALVTGVVADFHFQSLHKRIEPIAIMGMNPKTPDARYFYLKTSAKNLDEIKVLWRKLFPAHEFDYFFLNEFFDAQYKADENLRLLFLYFTLLT
ncbi:MAG TPA: ABC transporter permease, partial [Sphingobacteriaceae bacterium]